MRIAEVEIISMLMPSSASVSNIVAATPGFDFMPAPTMLTRAMSRSVDTPVGADLVGQALADLGGGGEVGLRAR